MIIYLRWEGSLEEWMKTRDRR